MLKNFKKKSLKAKIGIIAFIVFMLVLVAYVLYSNFKPEPPAEYEMVDVVKGTITDCLNVSGTVESGVSEKFVAVEGVAVQEVFVKVGDRVEKGDKIATFDVSKISSYLNDAKKDYDEALKNYNDANKFSNDSAKRKAEIESEINKTRSEISALEKEIASLENNTQSSQPVTESQTLSQEQIDAIVAQMTENGATQEQIDGFIAGATQIHFPSVSADTSNSESLLQKKLELSQLNSKLSALQAENAVNVSSGTGTAVDSLKNTVDAKKAYYESIKKIYDKMNNGWYAENGGIVTKVNIKAGEAFVPVAETNGSSFDIASLFGSESVNGETMTALNSLLGTDNAIPTGTGAVIESYDDMVVSVTVGKSDLLKIKVGMEATVLSLGSEYKGEVIYVGATAAESSEMSLGSITSSLMGGSGANGAVVKVKVKNPDEKIIIGFDVDIKIKLATYDNVLKVPVESVIYNNGEYFVFVFDEKEGVANKRSINKGSLDETSYEVVSGLTEGEKVVKSPEPNMEDGTKVAKKSS